MKKKRNNYSSGESDESITKFQTGEIQQVRLVCEYGIQCQELAQTYKNKIENVAEKSTGSFPVLGEAIEKDLVHW